MESEEGSRFVPWSFGRYRAIAPGLLFARTNTLPVTLLAKTECSLLSISKTAVLSLCRQSDKFHGALLEAIEERLRLLVEKLWEVEFSSIGQRLAKYLMDLREAQRCNRVRLPHTWTELAETFRVARPSLARIVSCLSRKGLIESRGRTVRIVDPQRLSSLLPRL